MVNIRRVYDEPVGSEGKRYLVDRLWPRGIRKADMGPTVWLKDLAPSSELREWFSHEPEKWEEFRERFRRELEQSGEAQRLLRTLADEARAGTITLLYGARDRERNNAVVLKEIIEEMTGAR